MTMPWDEFVEECSEVLDDLEDIPDAGYDFAESVEEKVRGMQAFAEDSHRVTSRMETALQNIRGGVERWLEGANCL